MCVMQRAMNLFGHIVGLIGALCFVLSISAVLSVITQSTAVASTPDYGASAPTGMVTPFTTLDTSQVDDLRDIPVVTWTYADTPSELWDALAEQHVKLYTEAPGDAPGEGAFLVPAGTTVVIDGLTYTLTANDLPPATAADYGAGAGAVCDTDADCAAWSRAHGEEPSGYAAGKG
jgi:hypothetical protein